MQITSQSVLFNSGEHILLGNAVPLQGVPNNQLTFRDINDWTYGEFVALAGDFYGTPGAAISDGTDLAAMQDRVKATYALMANGDMSVLTALRQLVLGEVTGINQKRQQGQEPSEYYKALGSSGDVKATLIMGPRYLQLAATNYDHFGEGALAAYRAAHSLAIGIAAYQSNHDIRILQLAYIYNAIADHFLTDIFSAGHLRVQRKQFHTWSVVAGFNMSASDYLAKYVHDEDSKYGLNVENARGDHWMCFGDAYCFDTKNQQNLQICEEAASLSKQEIFDAWNTGAYPANPPYAAENLIPNFAKAEDWSSNPAHRILLTFNGDTLYSRSDVNDLTDSHYSPCATAITTLTYMKAFYNL